MIILVLSLIIGFVSGYLYAVFFVKRYALIAHHKLQSLQLTEDKSPLMRQISINSFFRHIFLSFVLVFLFLYVKLNLIFWLIGFIFAFWYGILTLVKGRENN